MAWVRGFSFVLILFQSLPCFLSPLFILCFLDGACMLTYKLFSYAGMGMMPGMGRGAFNNMTGMGNGFGMQGHFNPAFMQGGGVPAAVGGQGGPFPPDGPRKRFRVDESR